jgi:hypothetical protein
VIRKRGQQQDGTAASLSPHFVFASVDLAGAEIGDRVSAAVRPD